VVIDNLIFRDWQVDCNSHDCQVLAEAMMSTLNH